MGGGWCGGGLGGVVVGWVGAESREYGGHLEPGIRGGGRHLWSILQTLSFHCFLGNQRHQRLQAGFKCPRHRGHEVSLSGLAN